MPFPLKTLRDNADLRLTGAAKDELLKACDACAAASTPRAKTKYLHDMMAVLDREVNLDTRWAIMQACGRRCIGKTVLDKARRLRNSVGDLSGKGLEDLLGRLNEAEIGGGQLRLVQPSRGKQGGLDIQGDSEGKGMVIEATYDRCYCGSVSQTTERFSPTYCQCSCGWMRQLFETMLERPVQVELIKSVIQGHDCCRFLIKV